MLPRQGKPLDIWNRYHEKVNWYLTTDDRSNDGNIRGYLDRDKDRIYDPGLFDVLRDMRTRKENDVKCFADRGLIPGAIYFDSFVRPLPSDLNLTLAEKQLARERWHQEALAACDSSDLVFLDRRSALIITAGRMWSTIAIRADGLRSNGKRPSALC